MRRGIKSTGARLEEIDIGLLEKKIGETMIFIFSRTANVSNQNVIVITEASASPRDSAGFL